MSRFQIRDLAVRGIALAMLLIAAGCDIPRRPLVDPEDERQLTAAGDGADASQPARQLVEPPGDRFGGQWESWDAHFLGDRHVGFSHLRAIEGATAETVRYELESCLAIERGESRLIQRLSLTSTETVKGNLIDFQSVLRVGPTVTRMDGAVDDRVLRVQTIRGSSETTSTIDWKPSFRGLVAPEQSLRRRPMTEKGQARTLRMLLPGQAQLATANLRCTGTASVPLMDGTLAELVETTCEIRGDQGASSSTIWTDQQGNIVRTYSPSLRLVSYRTDRETATRLDWQDSLVASINVGGKPMIEPTTARRVAFLIRPLDPQAPIEIQPAPGQYVRSVDNGSVQVLVSRNVEKVTSGFLESDLAASDQDLQPNHFIDSNQRLVQRYARVAISSPQRMTDREIATELTRMANELTQPSSELRGFVKASEVVQESLADATGRAVLLAALLRVHRIPARLAIGLKYADWQSRGVRQMEFHVWTLANVDDTWIHLDATEGRPAAADRLVISTTNLSGGSETDALVPFLELIGKISIELVGQR